MYNLIKNKQLKLAHNKSEIESIVNEYTKGSIPDYQMSAWLMAVYFNSMTSLETTHYTKSLVNSAV